MKLFRNRPAHSLWFCLVAASAALSAPRLFYSDLESGPNTKGENNAGVYVSVYGKGFGLVKGSAYVTVGEGKAANYPIWKDDKITFQLGSAATTGNIVVVTASGSSNPLPFTVRAGNIYFVSPNGKDSNNGSFAAPLKTLLKARDSFLKAGDTAYLMDGFAQPDDDGQGWRTTFLLRTGGTPDAPIGVVAYPGAKATFGTVDGPNSSIRTTTEPPGYWTFAGLTLRAVSEAAAIYGGAGWRFVANDMSCPNGFEASACFEFSVASNVKMLGNTVHDAGRPTASALYHGVYFSSDTNFVEVGWNHIYNVRGCRGIQIHSSPLQGGGPKDPTGHSQYGIVIHDNLIHDTQCDGIILATIDPSKGKVEIYNNVIYNAGTGPNNPEKSGNWACINAQTYTNTGPTGSGVVEIYNNTMFNCGTFANPPYNDSRSAIAYNGPNANITVRLRNNLVYQTSGIPYLKIFKPGNASQCGNAENCPWVYGSNNLFYGVGAPPGSPNLTNTIGNKDPLLGNLRTADFRIAANSPARRAGVDTGLATDRLGVPRGGKNGFDIGAHQYSDTTVATLNCPSEAVFTPAKINCDISVEGEIPDGGLQVQLASLEPSIAAPASVTIPAGANHAAVEIQVNAVQSRVQSTISANLGDVMTSTLIWLLPPGDTAPLMLKVANAASFLPDGISPGAIVTLFGLNMGPRAGSGLYADGSSIATSLSGTRVLFDGNPAPLVYVQSGQITATVPYNLTAGNTVFLQVEAQGQRSNPLTLPLLSVTPGLFTLNASGLGQGLFINQDGSINSPFRPAPRGSTVLFFAAGLGQTDPPVTGNQIGPAASAKPTQPMWVKLGDLTAPLGTVAPRTDFPGLFQMAVQVPQDAITGNAVPFQLAAGEQTSQSGVTIAII